MTEPGSLRSRLGDVRRVVNRRRFALGRTARLEDDGLHLVRSPVFLLSSVRSGSTLLRSMLDTHTQIVAPHELHLGTMRVSSAKQYAVDSWEALGLSLDELQNVLWDRALHLALVRGGGRIVVDKTPQNVEIWQRIHAFWPHARYLHLRRHPGSVYESLVHARPDQPTAAHVANVARYGGWLDAARAALPGPTVRYEDLTADPATTLRAVCAYLGVRYQTRMLTYRRSGNRGGLGDWSENIHSGRVQQARPLPALADVPAELRDLTTAWGY
ncbi:Sulfotransferase family protein [Jatrophihabitans endophyticus]|uniref:Sulfotransferase family protein n=1 Tax=Jatrophihabitans endophyticus TaxID=1206085 RepID=A0A1M5GT87_9ACTN|nr:sulfotransferase [Jatrophihabitans endophyticus]SHG06901.1 Sulfotransferase family protein [Jatrophihabitans endophyticus]